MSAADIRGWLLVTLFGVGLFVGTSVVEQELARLMAAIGRIGSNVNQLARMANAGSWPDSRLLKQACDDIRIMRDTLIRAFGMTPPDDPPPPAGL